MSEESIRALPIWQNDIEIELLSGGLTNVNYLVVDGDGAFAVREVEDDPLLGISRSSELACSRAAATLGIAPGVAYAAPGVLVADFISNSVPLDPEQLSKPDMLQRAARAIRRIHDAGPGIAGHMMYFSPFQVARTYVAIANEHGLPLPPAADDLENEIAELRAGIAPSPPTFCHNDMMPANFLDDGERIWIIDWEYAGIGAYPMFDLAGLSSNCDFDDEADALLLAAYSDDGHSVVVGREFQILKTMAALRECLWAVVQGSQSTIEFDYAGYRDENFAKYGAFREVALGMILRIAPDVSWG